MAPFSVTGKREALWSIITDVDMYGALCCVVFCAVLSCYEGLN